ncbi:MAG: universal stress protein UspA [Bacillota bacterium]|nr:universal stress protein UspA [Bacillota bacterium]
MKNIMVCVTQQRSCDRLIRYGHGLVAEGKENNLFIIHVAHYQFKFLGNTQEGEALEYLYEKALEYGAQLTVVRSNHVLDTLADLVKKYQITHIVLGESGETQTSSNVVELLRERVKDQAEVLEIPSS